MAREQRKDVDYFPHDCTHGRKMHIIETKYGNDGYATWFKLLEQLGKANNHYIDISDEMTLMFLTSTFKIDEEKTLLILNDLSKLGAIDKFLFDEYRIIWSEKFCNSIEDAYRKRKQKLFLKEDILMLKTSISRGNPSISRGLNEKQIENSEKVSNRAEVIPKVNKSKEKESKEENSKVKSKSHSGNKMPVAESTKHWKAIVDLWFRRYEEVTLSKPTFNKANAANLKSIILRLEKMYKAKNEIDWDELAALKTFNRFLDNALKDEWLKANLLITHLSSKFDVIVNQPKDGTKSNNTGTSNNNTGYKPASVDTNELVRKLTDDAQNGNIPGVYTTISSRNQN